jgi:type IV pilus assembly protein PilC
MPYYLWKGVSIVGKDCSGRLVAANQQRLEQLLCEVDIGLVSYKEIPLPRFGGISLERKADFFEQLSKLLESGLLVPQALSILSLQGYGLLGEIARECSALVQQGKALHETVILFPEVFDSLIVYLVWVGEKSSLLALSLGELAKYLHARVNMQKHMARTFMMPLVTFSFFIIVVLIMLFGLFPAFERLFIMINQPPPTYTAALFSVSRIFAHPLTIVIAPIVFLLVFFSWIEIMSPKYLLFRGRLILAVPIISKIVISWNYSCFFQSLSVLLSGGVTMVSAIKIAANTMKNPIIRSQLISAADSVESGAAFSQTIAPTVGDFDPAAIALILVGEQTGTLSVMCRDVARHFFEKTKKIISVTSNVLQPSLIALLGLFIVVLILSIYMPLLKIPDIIQPTFS